MSVRFDQDRGKFVVRWWDDGTKAEATERRDEIARRRTRAGTGALARREFWLDARRPLDDVANQVRRAATLIAAIPIRHDVERADARSARRAG